MNTKYENQILIGGITLFVIIIGILTWKTVRSHKHVVNNQQSEDKMTVLNEAFQSVLGVKWPYVLLAFTILLGTLLYFIYLASSKGALSITMSDVAAKRLSIILLCFTVVFSVFVIVLTIKQILNYKRRENTGDIPNYTPSVDEQKKNTKILIIVGLSLFIIFGGGFAFWLAKNKK